MTEALVVAGALPPARPVSFAATTTREAVYTRACVLVGGQAVGATAGGPAVLTIRAGNDASAPIVGQVSVPAPGRVNVVLPACGVYCPDGISITSSVTIVTGSLFIIDVS